MKSSGVVLSVGVAAVALVGFVPSLRDIPLHETATGWRYWSADLGELEVQGVCNADPKAFACWLPDGRPSEKLTRKATAFFSLRKWQRPSQATNDSRVVMVHWVDRASRGGYYGGGKVASGERLLSSGMDVDQKEFPSLTHYLWVNKPSSEPTTDLDLEGTIFLPERPPLPLKEGSTYDSPFGSYRVQNLTKLPFAEAPGVAASAPKNIWQFSLDWTPARNGVNKPRMGLNAVDSQGKPIGAVTADGVPGTPDAPWPSNPAVPPVRNKANDIYVSRIRPDLMAGLKIREFLVRTVTFKNVHLNSGK